MVSLIMGRGWKGIVAIRIREVVDQIARGENLAAMSAAHGDRG